MKYRCLAPRLFALGLLLVPTLGNAAQPQGNLPPGVVRKELEGIVEAVAPGRILMTDDQKQTWVVTRGIYTSLTVTGAGPIDLLTNGAWVSVRATIDPQGNGLDKPDTVWLSSRQLSVLQPEDARPAAGLVVGPAGEPPPPPKPLGPQTEPKCYDIWGQIKRIDGQKLLLSAENRLIKIEMADRAVVKNSACDARLIARGDKITVIGKAQGNTIEGEIVRIELAKELKPAKAHAKPAAPPKPPPKPTK